MSRRDYFFFLVGLVAAEAGLAALEVGRLPVIDIEAGLGFTALTVGLSLATVGFVSSFQGYMALILAGYRVDVASPRPDLQSRPWR